MSELAHFVKKMIIDELLKSINDITNYVNGLPLGKGLTEFMGALAHMIPHAPTHAFYGCYRLKRNCNCEVTISPHSSLLHGHDYITFFHIFINREFSETLPPFQKLKEARTPRMFPPRMIITRHILYL